MINQSMFELIENIIRFIIVFSIWTLLIHIPLIASKFIYIPNQSKGRKKYWFAVFICSGVTWLIVKVDPPEPIPSLKRLFNAEQIEVKRLTDSLAIDTDKNGAIRYVYSIDSTVAGVYYWKDNKKILLRKFTVEEITGGEQRIDLDSLELKRIKF